MSVRRRQFLAVKDGAGVRVLVGSVHLYHTTVHLDLKPLAKMRIQLKDHMVRTSQGHKLELTNS